MRCHLKRWKHLGLGPSEALPSGVLRGGKRSMLKVHIFYTLPLSLTLRRVQRERNGRRIMCDRVKRRSWSDCPGEWVGPPHCVRAPRWTTQPCRRYAADHFLNLITTPHTCQSRARVGWKSMFTERVLRAWNLTPSHSLCSINTIPKVHDLRSPTSSCSEGSHR